jgi:hypothetical protein
MHGGPEYVVQPGHAVMMPGSDAGGPWLHAWFFFFFFDIHLRVSWGTSPYVACIHISFLYSSALPSFFYFHLALDLLPTPIRSSFVTVKVLRCAGQV